VAVQPGLEGEYPGIEHRARLEGAEIHWGDETALVNTDVRGRSFAPAGKTPVALTVGGTHQIRITVRPFAMRQRVSAMGNLNSLLGCGRSS